MGPVYLKNIADGSVSVPISVNEKPKIDYRTPRLGDSVVDQDGNTVNLSEPIYATDLTFTITDEHLKSIIVNSIKMDVDDNVAEITLESLGGRMDYAIEAVDEAGNVFKINVTILAQWLKTKLIPDGSEVMLDPGNLYTLGSGMWKVGGDSTTYTGGMGFYVRTPGKYTFTSAE